MQKSELTSQSSAQLVYLALEKLLSTKMDLSTVSRTLLRKFCLRSFRLGNHWSHRHLNRQAAGDLGPDRAEQHLLGEDEPDRGCGRGPDHLRRGSRGRALQGLGEVSFPEVYFSQSRATVEDRSQLQTRRVHMSLLGL